MTPIISLALVLQLHNLAGAPPATLDRASSELTRVYRELGVSLEWTSAVTGAPVGANVLSVIVLPDETGNLRHTPDTVMGAALRTPSGTRVAYVFYRRVRAEAERYAVSSAFVLACAMAHDLGHLLLPGHGHSPDGMMRARWSRDEFQRADQGTLRFSSEQALLLRASIPSRAEH